MNISFMNFEFSWDKKEKKSDDDMDLLKNYQNVESFYKPSLNCPPGFILN